MLRGTNWTHSYVHVITCRECLAPFLPGFIPSLFLMLSASQFGKQAQIAWSGAFCALP